MTNKTQLLFGMIAGVVFIFGTLILGMIKQDYSAVAQTVSEIGSLGSALEIPYTMMLLAVVVFSLGFCRAAYRVVKLNNMKKFPLYLIGFFALMDLGFAVFPSPHKLHNLFGLLHVIAYLAPLFVAISWKGVGLKNHLTGVSWLAFIAISLFMFLNLSPMFLKELYPLEYYGVVQRGLLYSYYAWLVFLSFVFYKNADHLVNK